MGILFYAYGNYTMKAPHDDGLYLSTLWNHWGKTGAARDNVYWSYDYWTNQVYNGSRNVDASTEAFSQVMVPGSLDYVYMKFQELTGPAQLTLQWKLTNSWKTDKTAYENVPTHWTSKGPMPSPGDTDGDGVSNAPCP